MKRIRLIVLSSLLLTPFLSSAASFKPGDVVDVKRGSKWYPGIVQSKNVNQWIKADYVYKDRKVMTSTLPADRYRKANHDAEALRKKIHELKETTGHHRDRYENNIYRDWLSPAGDIIMHDARVHRYFPKAEKVQLEQPSGVCKTKTLKELSKKDLTYLSNIKEKPKK